MTDSASGAATGGAATGAVRTANEYRGASRAPVVVLTYAHAGAELLTQALSASSSLACTAGTGLVPLCHAAATTWQNVENLDTGLSSLAIKSIRSLASTLVTSIQARAGASRWCELAFAAPTTAGTFLQVFPGATFLCLHRSLQGVLAEGMRTYPWGLRSSPFWHFSGAHPGNSAAAIAAYWAGCAEPLMAFEAEHPRSCLRIRYEDLAADFYPQAEEIYGRLGLDACDLAVLRQPRDPPDLVKADDSNPEPPVPVAQIPPELLAKIRGLLNRLGYADLA